MRKTFAFLFFLSLVVSSNAQENKPLIPSGEIIDSALRLHDNGKYEEALENYKRALRIKIK
ncbi:MAG: tetratricopeptide repeat protein, partial [Bacteroidota bacterium]